MKFLNKMLASVAGLFALGMSTAYAVVPVGVDTAVDTAVTDATTVAGYIIIALAGLLALKWMTSLVKKA